MMLDAHETLQNIDSGHELYGLDADPFHEHWLEIVETYTDAHITKPEDKLVAISGLAREVHGQTKDLYCAGIWEKDVIRQLLWRAQTPQPFRYKAYRAPSWSWASVDGKVTFMARTTIESYPELSVSNTRTLGTDSSPWSFGQISYGFIRVRGALKTTQRCERRNGAYKLLLTDELDELENDLQVTYGDFYPNVIPMHLAEQSICQPVSSYVNSEFATEKENRGIGFLARLVIVPTGDFQHEYQHIRSFSIPNPAGRAWFGDWGQQDFQDIIVI